MNSRNSAKQSKAGTLDRRALRLTLLVALSIVLAAILAYAGREEAAAPPVNAQQSSTPADWKAVEQALGKAGAMQPGDVFKAGLPRTDLNVTVRGVQVKPALALGSWVAFKKMGSEAMVMGDLVLTEDEVSPVMMKLQQGGIEQTALHNHVLGEAPRVMYMHISGHGDPVKMAHAIHDALALSKTPFTSPAAGAPPSQDIGIDTKQIDQIMGYSGKVNGGVYQFAIPRSEKIMDAGMEVPPAMGTAIAINFQPTGAGKAAITGDYVMLASEVNPVIRALRESGIEVTALHSHMLNESPHLFFMHFWANDDALKLARGLRAALDHVAAAKP
jgi:hypothetical protein